MAYIFTSISRMESLLAARRIDFLVACYPDQIQVDSKVRNEFLERLHIEERTWQWKRPQQLLSRFCDAHQIEFFDLLPIFEDHCRRGESLYIPSDTHWNTRGNRLASEAFHSYLAGSIRRLSKPGTQDP